MTKDESIKLMLETFQKVNRIMAEQAGMDAESIENNIAQSSPSIQYMLSEVYEALVANKVINE